MRAFHNSRDCAYRAPFGAVATKTQVTLTIDVWDTPDATVQLRTWTDEEGEAILDMDPVADKTRATIKAATAEKDEAHGPATRFEVSFSPKTAGIMWYHFIITTAEGQTYRLGVQTGHRGGASQVLEWEPPSYQLTIYEPGDLAPTWHRPIDGYLYDASAEQDFEEIIQTLRENYPAPLLNRTFGWDANVLLDERDLKKLFETRGMPTPGASGPMWRFAVNDDVFGFWYRNERGRLTCTLMNASLDQGYDVAIPLVNEVVSELLGGGLVPVGEVAETSLIIPTPQSAGTGAKFARLHLGLLGAFDLYFHKAQMLQKPMEPGVGVLAHITSLPTEASGDGKSACKTPVQAQGASIATASSPVSAPISAGVQKAHPGTLGTPARTFVDWLAEAGVRYWQILPVNPTDEYGSPYAGISAFAGNTHLLEGTPSQIVDALSSAGSQDAYQEFCEREAAWLEPYASFMAIRRKIGPGAMWQNWPEIYRTYNPDVIKGDDELALYACIERRLQFVFDTQWRALRAYANDRNVQIIGDMPIYVSADSADVWAHPELFQLDEDGAPRVVAGCPPDDFAADGQIWGNPVYDWATLKATGYDWWLRRLERAFELYDMTRLDHFIGFSRYFSIPADGKASEGTYRPGPGIELFQAAFDQLGPLPIVAEDLGIVTPGVRALCAACGFLGMDIIQFADGDQRESYTPRPGKIAYTGTHDNQTLLGFCETYYGKEKAAETAAKLMKNVLTSSADVCIIPLQDVLGLDDEARMNVPGVAEGNWSWQADASAVRAALPAACKLVQLFR